MPTKITADMLQSKGACPEQVDKFETLFPTGTRPTAIKCKKYALDFDWDWAASNLLSADGRKAYNKGCAPLEKTYNEGRVPLWKAYEKGRAPLLKAYEEGRAPLWKTYEEGRAPLLKAYKEGCAPFLKAYEKGLAMLFATLWAEEN